MRLNVYVPDELGEQVRAADLNVSRVCQNALRNALDPDYRSLLDLQNEAITALGSLCNLTIPRLHAAERELTERNPNG